MAEGFPMPSGWMMVTLTVNPDWFEDECDAYKYLKPKVTRYMKQVAEKLYEWGYFEEARHCVNWWKFEFQANGWPHWHVFTNLTKRVSEEQLKELCGMWKWGRVEYKHCDQHGHYAFKYAFKAPLKKYNSDNLKNAVPEWFLNYYEIKDGKPEAFDRVRFFQRSRNFLANFSDWLVSQGKEPHDYKVMQPRKKDKPKSCHFPRPVWMVLDEKMKKVQVIARNEHGDYLKSKTIHLNDAFHTFEHFLTQGTLNGDVVSIKPNHYFLEKIPAGFAQLSDKHKLKQICQNNKMTMTRAKQLRQLAFRKLAQISAYASKE